jgi:pilus assembly protein CpaC
MLIAALRENSLLRVLAEPNLTAISGQEANFLAGGEIPIPVPQDSGGGSSTITIEYKEFGVGLKFVPLVLGDGRIRLKCAPEVSDLDFTNAVTLQGFRVPAITKRSLSTTVELKEGQTLALAGLLNSRITSSSSVVPLLGDIPVLGALFRSQSYNRQETELVVLVTPRLVSGMNNDQLPALPGEKWRTPTEGELFWLNDLGGELPAVKKPVAAQKPARFQGNYGFAPVEAPAADKKATPANTAGSAVSPAKQGATTVQPTTKATGK